MTHGNRRPIRFASTPKTPDEIAAEARHHLTDAVNTTLTEFLDDEEVITRAGSLQMIVLIQVGGTYIREQAFVMPMTARVGNAQLVRFHSTQEVGADSGYGIIEDKQPSFIKEHALPQLWEKLGDEAMIDAYRKVCSVREEMLAANMHQAASEHQAARNLKLVAHTPS